MRRWFMIGALMIPVICSAAGPARADGTVRGRVQWTSGNTVLVFKDEIGAERRMLVDPGARITHNGQPVGLDQLRMGWAIAVFYVDGPNGPVAVAIAAESRFVWASEAPSAWKSSPGKRHQRV